MVDLLVDRSDAGLASWREAADVVGHGIKARAEEAGLAGRLSDPAAQGRAGLASFTAASVVFLTFAMAVWSQLAVGWRWEPPTNRATAVAMVATSTAAFALAVLVGLAILPVVGLWVWAAVVGRPSDRGGVRVPGLVVVAAAGVLYAGSVHFADGWPGTGGHHWGWGALAPQRLGSLCWAASRGITSYWAHPGALARFDTAEVLWMALSLAAVVGLAVGGCAVVRRLEIPPLVLRVEGVLLRLAVTAMVVFVSGAWCWVIAGGAPGPTGIYQVGSIDAVAVVMMSVAAIAAGRAAKRVHGAGQVLVRWS